MTDEAATSRSGPVLGASMTEVQGVFPSDAAMQKAIGNLTLAGFDRAALSLPTGVTQGPGATPTEGASDPMTDVDVRQARTMTTSMAGTIGAFAAAGATIATGGAAGVAIAAAAALGAGSALAVNAAGNAVDSVQSAGRDEAAGEGRLVLAVAAQDSEWRGKAEQIMREAGATSVGGVERVSEPAVGYDSSSWTG